MHINTLSEDKPIEVIEITSNKLVPSFLNQKELEKIETIRIIKEVLTDGSISKEKEETIKPITAYYIANKKYNYDIDTLKSKQIYFKDFNYVITYLKVLEYKKINGTKKWIPTIKEINIYLDNIQDKQALKKAKLAISNLVYERKKYHYTKIYHLLFKKKKFLNYERQKVAKNIYSLKRK